MIKLFTAALLSIFILLSPSIAVASSIISGISTNEINIDTKFNGAEILLFGAKDDFGNIVIAVRGPKKNFLVTRKEKLFGIWHNGKRVKMKESYSYYSFFSTARDTGTSEQLMSELELGKNNIDFNSSADVNPEDKNEFQIQLVDYFEKEKLYLNNSHGVDFLDETLFKVMLKFPKNIARGLYSVEIYLINDNNLSSFQTIPIYVNQVGLSARVLDFAYQQSFLYGLLSIALALVVGWLANYLFVRFIGK
jgi:uncharacterized protein (TIGR02186 family)